MPEMSIFWLRVAAVLYALGLLHATVTILQRKSRLFRVALGAFIAATLLHFVSLVELGAIIGHLPADNFYETASMAAFLFAVAFLFVHWRYEFESLSVIVFPLVFVLTLVGATEIPVSGWSNPSVRGVWLLVHVGLVLIGYAAILLTAVASVFYLVQEKRLKQKRVGVLEGKLPPLGTLDKMITTSMSVGFVFITSALIIGSTWAFVEYGTKWIGSAKIAISFITWAFYLAMIFLRVSAGWRGRKAAFLALSVLCFSAMTWAAHVGLRPMLEK